jgi:hypothetical protein
MVLTFSYKDGVKHTTFDEVKSSDLGELARPTHDNPNIFLIGEGFEFVIYLQPDDRI